MNKVLREEQQRGTVELRRGRTIVLDAAALGDAPAERFASARRRALSPFRHSAHRLRAASAARALCRLLDGACVAPSSDASG